MFLKLVGKPAVVAVAEGYIASPCPFDGLVAGIAGAVVFREEGQFHSFVFSLEAFKNLYCLLVCRMVVGDEQFEIGIGLYQHTPYAVAEEFPAVVGGHYY